MNGRSERQRLAFVYMVYGIYWLTILEGAARKWFLPEWSSALFFVKDPLVLASYGYALYAGLRPRWSAFLVAAGVFAVLAVTLSLGQLATGLPGYTRLLAAYGLRSYFLYLPLAFFIANHFRRADIDRLFRHSLVAIVPIALLVYLQYAAPADAAINAGATGEFINPGFGADSQLVRTYGTFTSSEAQNLFSVSVLAMLLIAWLRPATTGSADARSRRWLLIAAPAVATCVALSGSRGAVIWSALVISVSVAAVLLAGRLRQFAQTAVLMAVMLPAAFVMVGGLFPQALDAFAERWTIANADERAIYKGGVFGRAATETFFFSSLLTRVPILGHGVGTGGNAVSVTVDNGQFERIKAGIRLFTFEELAGAEQDWGRHVLDFGPFIGVGFILFRVAFTAWLGRAAVMATVRAGDPSPMILFAFGGLLLYQGHIVALGVGQAYGWLFVGLTMAMCRAAQGQRWSGSRPRRAQPREAWPMQSTG